MLPPLSISVADAARLRRHSFRHFLANCIRLLEFSLPDAFQGGRWKDHHTMPLRYPLETKLSVMVGIIVRVIQACQEAMRRVPFEQWPAFGGWEHLLPQREWNSVGVSVVAFDVEPKVGEVDDDSDDETASIVPAVLVSTPAAAAVAPASVSVALSKPAGTPAGVGVTVNAFAVSGAPSASVALYGSFGGCPRCSRGVGFRPSGGSCGWCTSYCERRFEHASCFCSARVGRIHFTSPCPAFGREFGQEEGILCLELLLRGGVSLEVWHPGLHCSLSCQP